MKYAKSTVNEIIEHIKKVTEEVDVDKVRAIMNELLSAKRVFVYGMGRSGLIAQAFAMRLANLNFQVHIVGGVTTPAIHKDDFLFLISGSGNTRSVVMAAEIAKEKGARVGALTSNPKSEIAKLADAFVIVKGRTKEHVEDLKKEYLVNQLRGQHVPYSPLGTLFEDTCLILLDAAIVQIMHEKGISEKEMKDRHTNIE
ncbi:MAG: 6-phospho-3-hexuloisomerase [archaeon]